MTTLTHLPWQPVILLKVVHSPFSISHGLSVQRAYLALDAGHLLYADWTLEAAERCAALVCPTGWHLATLPAAPMQLTGAGFKRIPSGTWILPYDDSVYALYTAVNQVLDQLVRRIEAQPTDPVTVATLHHLVHLF
jgi:hypothetical protein